MGKHQTQDEAQQALKQLETDIMIDGKLPTFYKKAWVDLDDHGYCLNVKVEKGNGDKIPRKIGNVKVLIYSV